jgi:SAM-dependent methyltransferase
MTFDSHMLNLSGYTTEMRKSLVDKMFFLDKIEADSFIDYGCADGTLLKFIRDLFPDSNRQLFGYDISPEMLEIARLNGDNINFSNDFNAIRSHLQSNKTKKNCLVLSSIIHEIYSYCSRAEVAEFWNRVFNSNFDYISIRDMSVSKTTSRQSDVLAVARVRQIHDAAILDQWESIWGSLNENWSLTHFLLKYRYKDNWDREVRENYLPISYEELLGKIPNSYFPTYIDHFTLPYIRNRVRKDFGIELADRTHIKLILELRK